MQHHGDYETVAWGSWHVQFLALRITDWSPSNACMQVADWNIESARAVVRYSPPPIIYKTHCGGECKRWNKS